MGPILVSPIETQNKPLSGPATGVDTKKAPYPLECGAQRRRVLLRCYGYIVQVHVGQVAVAVSVNIEVEADRLVLVRGRVEGLLHPGMAIGSDLHDLHQLRARGVLYLGFLSVALNGVSGGRPGIERQRGLGERARDGNALVDRRVSVRLWLDGGPQLSTVAATVLLRGDHKRRVHATRRPAAQRTSFEAAVGQRAGHAATALHANAGEAGRLRTARPVVAHRQSAGSSTGGGWSEDHIDDAAPVRRYRLAAVVGLRVVAADRQADGLVVVQGDGAAANSVRRPSGSRS